MQQRRLPIVVAIRDVSQIQHFGDAENLAEDTASLFPRHHHLRDLFFRISANTIT
jgi:hypothetical protein